ncbi:PAAR-like domain-containing protein [Variovorax sp. UC74_104]|uniref:PAAR-like domain-containing protein n=1 Tax=Variovorax sp. UC74_104 TaxID=3374555 RepID=UPI003756B9D3
MSAEKHIADAESRFMVVNIAPDFCVVGNQVVPFDIVSILPPEKAAYADTVFARSEKVLMVDSIVKGVTGNAGSGVRSGVSLGAGNVKIISGSQTVFVESRAVARHGDLCEMNGSA